MSELKWEMTVDDTWQASDELGDYAPFEIAKGQSGYILLHHGDPMYTTNTLANAQRIAEILDDIYYLKEDIKAILNSDSGESRGIGQ